MTPAPIPWDEANQQYLAAEIERLRELLAEPSESSSSAPARGEDGGFSPPPALWHLRAAFGLSNFETDLLLLCAGVELDAGLARACAAVQGEARPRPTFGFALAILPEAHWSAVAPSGPLRRWRLIELGPGPSVTSSPLACDERVLHYLAGIQHVDERLSGFLQPVETLIEPAASHRAPAERIAAIWRSSASSSSLPPIQLCGREIAGKRAIAAAACQALGLRLFSLAAELLPQAPDELDRLLRLVERESILGGAALLLDLEETDGGDVQQGQRARRFLARLDAPTLVAAREPLPGIRRAMIVIDVERPTRAEQALYWRRFLGESAGALNGQIDRLTAQFGMSAPAIRAACIQARGAGDDDTEALESRLWEASRVQARHELEGLAGRIEPVATARDLVLPPSQHETLREIVAQVRHRVRVYENWGFAARSPRGLGITALFSGASGTGKTMAAEVLAGELGLDLYHVDLAQVVSKYIGETEKNLRRVFDAAEEGAAVLLFDEADALFGKRSEVKDSHDRYANIEVSYLLQRMEAYRGLAILTTNMKRALDDAFQRRIRFMVDFPFPGAAQRAEIWRRIFPAETPTAGIEPEKLARLEVTGGTIRNIALHAAFIAADAEEEVAMKHLLRATRSVYARLEKPLAEKEIRGWV